MSETETPLDPNAHLHPVNTERFWRRRLNQAHARERHCECAVWDVSIDHFRKHLQLTKPLLHQHLRAGQRVLDAGCGVGSLCPLMPEGVDYYGIDLSPDFLEIARFRHPEGRFDRQDLNDLSVFADKSFDWAVARSVEGMVRENLGGKAWGRMRQELQRVAKKILLLDYSDPPIAEVLG